MKVAILAGGLGSRLSEETVVKPKALVEIGGRPILWHIMKSFAAYGNNEFTIALGYKGEQIKRFVLDYSTLESNLTVNVGTGHVARDAIGQNDDWTVELVDTGPLTNTGGRISRLEPHLSKETFLLSWCDGLSDLNFSEMVRFHRSHGRLATIAAVRLPSRFGEMDLDGDRVTEFREKPVGGRGWISGGFFVLEPGIFDYIISGDGSQWETGPLPRLVQDGELVAYRHHGFWQCMDTLREKVLLEQLWQAGHAPWRVWE